MVYIAGGGFLEMSARCARTGKQYGVAKRQKELCLESRKDGWMCEDGLEEPGVYKDGARGEATSAGASHQTPDVDCWCHRSACWLFVDTVHSSQWSGLSSDNGDGDWGTGGGSGLNWWRKGGGY